jgi:hypothetical protein
MDAALVDLVWERADSICEYCGLPAALSLLGFEIDHIIAQKHSGASVPNNLALSCFYDNCFKGPNIAGLDPLTDQVTRLFNPRRHKWHRHFRWHGPILLGRTAIGRATVSVLCINLPFRVAHRQSLIDEGKFPTLRND